MMEKKLLTKSQYEELESKLLRINYIVVGAFVAVATVVFGIFGFLFVGLVGLCTLPKLERNTLRDMENEYAIKEDNIQ